MRSKDQLKKSALKLSGGQKQRLAIARSLCAGPEILLLDEPCSALDMKNTIAIEETLLELKDQYTFVIVTHNLAQAKRIADQVIFMDHGEVLEVTEKEKFFENPASEPAKRADTVYVIKNVRIITFYSVITGRFSISIFLFQHLSEQFINHTRICFSFHCLHDLSNQCAKCFFFSTLEIFHCLWILCNHFFASVRSAPSSLTVFSP